MQHPVSGWCGPEGTSSVAEAERRPAPAPVLAPPGTSRLSSAVSCACGVAQEASSEARRPYPKP